MQSSLGPRMSEFTPDNILAAMSAKQRKTHVSIASVARQYRGGAKIGQIRPLNWTKSRPEIAARTANRSFHLPDTSRPHASVGTNRF